MLDKLPQFGLIGVVVFISFFAGMIYQRNLNLDAQTKALLEWVESNKGIYDALVEDVKSSDIKQDGPVAPILKLTINSLPIPAKKPLP